MQKVGGCHTSNTTQSFEDESYGIRMSQERASIKAEPCSTFGSKGLGVMRTHRYYMDQLLHL